MLIKKNNMLIGTFARKKGKPDQIEKEKKLSNHGIFNPKCELEF